MEQWRKRIIQEASELFMKQGPKSVTMDQVSEHCGISKRTLYEQFTDKNALLQECLKQINEDQQIIRHQLKLESRNVIDFFISSTRQTIESSYRFNPNFFLELKKYFPAVAEYQKQVSEEVMNVETAGVINEGIAEGLFRAELNVTAVVQLLKVQLESLYFSDLLAKHNLKLADTFHTLIFTFLRGIATAKGLELVITFEKA